MGLTSQATGLKAAESCRIIRRTPLEKIIAVAGNPNVGKSTIFNALTGMRQHTGNWTGKTVAIAQGHCNTPQGGCTLVDIPGTYSLLAHSAEEEVAREFLCLGRPDAAVVVCDATSLLRCMGLVLQICEVCPRTLVCVNLMDEAARKGVTINLELLSVRLGVPVCGTSARDKKSLSHLAQQLDLLCDGSFTPRIVRYATPIENALIGLEPIVRKTLGHEVDTRFLSLRLLEGDTALAEKLAQRRGYTTLPQELCDAVEQALSLLAAEDITTDRLRDLIVGSIAHTAEEVCGGAVQYNDARHSESDRRADRILTSRRAGYPVMLLLLLVVFWITIVGANYPSQWLGDILFRLGDELSRLLTALDAPEWLRSCIADGAYKTLAWVVSVMLPPMAIFFPLFTLLEDSGYLPRIAYNLDTPFRKCGACGKQALTMCMGFGCNAAGVVGCRIIDSKRERLIAMLTNGFVPCNGRFPTIIAVIGMFLTFAVGGLAGSLLPALLLTMVILLGIGMTFFASRLLSKTLLRGEPSSFTLELPPYRMPQFGKVIVRSMLDRTLSVLGRAAAVAAPAGIIIWAMANITVGGSTLLAHCTEFLDPFASLFGLDGVILMAFILGLPANEIVVPVIIMAYTAQGSITELDTEAMRTLFIDNGWTWVTAVSMILFTLLHFPCSTTLLTIKKESGSLRWALAAALLPTVFGLIVCFLFAQIAALFV